MSGHYVTVYKERPDGRLVATKVWVEDKPKPKTLKRPKNVGRTAAQSAARRRAEQIARQRARAEILRLRKIRQQQLARRRRMAYDTLQKRAKAIRDTRMAVPTPKPNNAQKKVLVRTYSARPRRPGAVGPAVPPKVNPAAAMKAGAGKDRQADMDLVERGFVKDKKAVEAYVRAKAAAAKTRPVNTKNLDKIAEQYASEASKVADKYTALVRKINKLIDLKKFDQARDLYNGEFKRLAKEFKDWFGTPGDPRKEGSVSKFFKDYDTVYKSQADWYKRQMQAALDSDRATLQSEIRRLREHGEDEQANELAKLLSAYNGNTRTALNYEKLKDDGRPTTRKLTLAEELERRQAEQRIAMEKIAAQAGARESARNRLLKGEGLVQSVGGQLATREEDQVLRDMARVVDEQFGGKSPSIKRPEDLSAFADRVVSDWVSRNPPPKAPAYLRGQENAKYQAALRAWGEERKRYEARVLQVYGEKPREWWDRVFQAPGASHALALLQGGVSSIGAGGRVLLKATTGSSQLDLGIATKDLPEGIRQQVERATAAASGPKDAWGVPLSINIGGQAVGQGSKEQILSEWFRTPEGGAWLKKRVEANKEKLSADDLAFLQGFYGEGDLGDKLDALNRYGQYPFSDEKANLAFQLLADPSNAIPLKFTTYLARGKYAAEAGNSSKFLKSSKFGTVRDFVKVDEGVLRARSSAQSLKKEVEALGIPDQQIVDRVMSDVMNIKSKTDQVKVIEARLRAAGVLKRAVNPDQLLSLIEEQLGIVIDAKGVARLTQAGEIRKKLDAEAAQRAATNEVRRARQVKAQMRAAEKSGARVRRAEAAGTRLEQAKTAQVKKIEGEIATLKARSGSAAAPGGSVGQRLKAALPDRKQSHFGKDVAKAGKANKFIGEGAAGSSTAQYAKALGGSDKAFKSSDTVFVSANGARAGRVPVTDASGKLTSGFASLDLAIRAKSTIVTDVLADRLRPYNIGERELANYLETHGYYEVSPGRWVPGPPQTAAEVARLGDLEKLLGEVTGMDRHQWAQRIEVATRRRLKDPNLTQAQRAHYYEILNDIRASRDTTTRAVRSGASAKDITRHANRVRSTVGKDARELFAPNNLAPYVEDARAVQVEYTRSLYRWLKAADPEDAEGVAALGPKFKDLDHFPVKLWEEVNAKVSEAIRKVQGPADYHTRIRRGITGDEEKPLGGMKDLDPAVLAAKKRVLKEYGISVDAYDEARQILQKPMLQARNAEYLLKQATVNGKFDADLFMKLRATAAGREAMKQLNILAREMHGAAPQDVLAEFIARYVDNGSLRTFQPKISRFQRRTLEAHFQEVSGVQLADQAAVDAHLASRNAPPIHSRAAMKDFLVRTGAWTPRTSETFTQGERSWSFRQEAEYMRTSYGRVPEWADEAALKEERLNTMFDHEDVYYREHERWGYFDRSAEIAIRQTDMTAEEVARVHIYGDEALGLKPKRELALRRKFAIERWGDLVTDADGNLVRMPWLMNEQELRNYLSARMAGGIAGDLIQNVDELRQVQAMVHDLINEYWDKYLGPKAKDGPIDHADVFILASKIQERMLQNPVWARRHRDLVGSGLNAWSMVTRWMVFSQVSFLTANVGDVPLKMGWYRYSNRGLFNRALASEGPEIAARARAINATNLGLTETTLMSPAHQKRAVSDYFTNPRTKGLARVLEVATGAGQATFRAFPSGAAVAETWGKVHLAQGMYPEAYRIFKATGVSDEIAHAGALRFVKKEVGRMWPTVGDHPLARLFNQLVPFGSYMIKNRILFISEALAHPSVLNQIEFIGRYVEQENRKQWAKDHPGEAFPEWAARRIELPWAPGTFLDVGVVSDATRGLSPIYKQAAGGQTYLEFASQFIRLINPTSQAGIYMLTNALGITSRTRYVPIRNEAGFITGYKMITEGISEPWSDEEPTWGSVNWVAEALDQFQKLGAGGWTNSEISVMLGKIFLFDGIRAVDKGASMYEIYKEMRAKNREAAERWLNTTEGGRYVKDWLAAHQDNPQDIADLFSLAYRKEHDPAAWFHTQDPAFQRKVTSARARIDTIRTAFEQRLLGLTPGTDEYKKTKAEMYLAVSEVYRQTPELMAADVYSKDASELAQQMERWQTDKLMDQFFALDSQRPKRAAYASKAAYDAAVAAWERQKATFLKTYPQVEAEVGGARTAFQRVRDQMEKEWDEVLTRTAERSEAIKAAKAAGDFEKADLLYLQQDLDYSLLEKDYVAMYFTDADYRDLKAREATPLRDGAIKIAKVLLDFDQIRYQKAVREGRGEQFLKDLDYTTALKNVILKAKGGDPFGKFDPAAFVKAVKADPKFAAQYFAKNPGKQQSWAKTDEYIRQIGRWGKLARAGMWDAAEQVWASLPQWVRDRYNATHPGRGSKTTQSAAYVGYLHRWVAFFEKNDVKGGMDFFWKMPSWVRERYFAKHPEKRAKWESQLKFGKQLGEYFAGDEASRAAYLKAHPQLAAFLKNQGGDKSFERNAIIAGYRAIPSGEAWLKRIYREKYPEIFSQEALGERRLKKVYDQLAAHPSILPAFEKWVDAIWGTYQEMLKHPATRAKSLELVRERRRKKLSHHGVSAQHASL